MTMLLKAGIALSKARPFGAALDQQGKADEPDPLREALESALLTLQQAEARIPQLELACLEAWREGEQAGLERGRAEAEEQRTKNFELLRAAVDRAQAKLTESLSSADQLAASIARTCLETIIGDSRYQADLVARALRHQLGMLDSSSVIRVAVSPADFPDQSALEALAQSSGAKIVADDLLSNGECRIDARLGSLDVGPVTQWRRLSDALGEIGGAGT